jgi:hypothetical protein
LGDDVLIGETILPSVCDFAFCGYHNVPDNETVFGSSIAVLGLCDQTLASVVIGLFPNLLAIISI